MSYAIRYERKTREELEIAYETYGGEFRNDVQIWLNELAEAAGSGKHLIGLDVLQVAEDVLRTTPSSMQHSLKKWWASGLREKVVAFIVLLTKRRPPWELWVDLRQFIVIGAFPAEVLAYYEVDHVKKCVVFRQFQGLPGAE